MKRFFPALILTLALAAAVWAANPAQIITQYGLFFTGTAGEPQPVTAANPLPVTVPSGTSITVAPQGSTSFAQQALSAGPTPASWTLTASGAAASLFNLGANTIWFGINTGGATVSSGIPLTATGTGQCQQSFSAGPGTVIWYVASVTTAFTALESGR